MTLGMLLDEIRHSPVPATPATLAIRLGTTVDDVTAMLSALRAAGMIGQSAARPTDTCPSATSCAVMCPGPTRCPLIADIGLETLAVRRG